MKKFASLFLVSALFCAAATAVRAQTRKPAKKNPKPAIESKSAPTETAAENEKSPQKKNARDEAETRVEVQEPQKKNQKSTKSTADEAKTRAYKYFYEFTSPQFIVRDIVIEHDENGQGKISFTKKDYDEPVVDPVKLSPATMEKIKTLLTALNFVASSEEYQSSARDFKHLGTSKFRLREDGKERTVEFNWTENKDAKALADEYRKISNQYIWQFDVNIARENQPLEAPGLMDVMDSYLRRGEISDPPQMTPFLKELSNDERIPLIARNHAAKLAKQIEKGGK